MKLANRCNVCFGSKDKARGREYFRHRRVQITHVDGDRLCANVQGSGSYDVDLNWSRVGDGKLTATCECPLFVSGKMCKHVWAVILQADSSGYSSRVPGRNPLHVTRFSDKEAEDDGALAATTASTGSLAEAIDVAVVQENPVTHAGGRLRSPARRKHRAPQWQSTLRQLSHRLDQQVVVDVGSNETTRSKSRAREIWYILDATDSSERGALVIAFYQRQVKKNGQFGKLKKLTMSSAETAYLDNSDDRKILGVLVENETDFDGDGYGRYRSDWDGVSHGSIPVAWADMLLPQLASTGRFMWILNSDMPIDEARKLAWDERPAWQFRLKVAADDQAKRWHMMGELVCQNQVMGIDQVVMLSQDGFVLFPDMLASFEVDQFHWATALAESMPLTIPYTDRDKLLEQLWSMPSIPDMDLPNNLGVEQVAGQPHGCLLVQPPERWYDQRFLWAKIQFGYGETKISQDDRRRGIYQQDAGQVLLRDLERERQLGNEIQALDLGTVAGYLERVADLLITKKQLPDIVYTLSKIDWTVILEGVHFRSPGEFKLQVTSDVDWFGLEGQLDYGGVSASLPTLLAAVRKGARFIELDNGSRGMLPESWLEKYGRLAELGEAAGEVVRFTNNQALLLDALLAEQEHVQLDTRFIQFREKLKNFSGVRPVHEPDDFQGELRGYQRDGLGWLQFLNEFSFGGCLADDMGLGKTVQVLALLAHDVRRQADEDGTTRPSLVVVPKSLIFNWMDEAQRFTPQLRLLNFTGTERKQYADQLNDYDVVLTTYGTLRRDIVTLKGQSFRYAILDEAQAIKNAQSQSAKSCRLLLAQQRLIMTGTPVENHLGELWSLFEFLNPGMLGSSAAFAALSKSTRGGDESDLDLLRQALRPFILRRTKNQVLTDLPEKTEQTLYCELTGKHRKQYNELRGYYRAQLDKTVKEKGLKRSKIHVLEALLRLRQTACHPGLVDKSKRTEMSAKLESLLEQLQEIISEGHKALVFSQFTSLLSIVRHHLDKRQIVYEYLDGKTRRRDERVKRFQNDSDCPLFLISLKAGGQGLNLTAADYVFILDPWWNPAVEAQAVDRAHRIGQTRRVFAYRLIARDTVEEKILQLQQSKRELADAIVSADNSVMGNLTSEDLELLLS